METIIIIVFLAGYLAITLEHNLKIDKLIPALAMMAILWAIIALTSTRIRSEHGASGAGTHSFG